MIWEEICDFHAELDAAGLSGVPLKSKSESFESENVAPDSKKPSAGGNGFVSPVAYDQSVRPAVSRAKSASQIKDSVKGLPCASNTVESCSNFQLNILPPFCTFLV